MEKTKDHTAGREVFKIKQEIKLNVTQLHKSDTRKQKDPKPPKSAKPTTTETQRL